MKNMTPEEKERQTDTLQEFLKIFLMWRCSITSPLNPPNRHTWYINGL
jgi:hypothetical protein